MIWCVCVRVLVVVVAAAAAAAVVTAAGGAGFALGTCMDFFSFSHLSSCIKSNVVWIEGFYALPTKF